MQVDLQIEMMKLHSLCEKHWDLSLVRDNQGNESKEKGRDVLSILLCDLNNQIDAIQIQKAKIRNELVRMAHELGDSWSVANLNNPRLSSGGNTFGIVDLPLRYEKVLRGYIEVRSIEPIASNLSDDLVTFLHLKMDAGDFIQKENGGYGYHFHYLDRQLRRSDILLTFPMTKTQVNEVRTLTWERHGKSCFKAKADEWGKKKRISVHAACSSYKIDPREFKIPHRSAQPLWPLV